MVDERKSIVETRERLRECPGVASCANILAITVRNFVVVSLEHQLDSYILTLLHSISFDPGDVYLYVICLLVLARNFIILLTLTTS